MSREIKNRKRVKGWSKAVKVAVRARKVKIK